MDKTIAVLASHGPKRRPAKLGERERRAMQTWIDDSLPRPRIGA